MKNIGIKNSVITPQIYSPSVLAKKIFIDANIAITKDEADLFSTALGMLNVQLRIDNIDLDNIRSVNIIFTGNGGYEFYSNFNATLGIMENIIVYAIDRLRIRKVDGYKYIAIYLEELIHHFYNSEDEVFVKEKILETCINNNLKVTKQQLFYYEDGYVQ